MKIKNTQIDSINLINVLMKIMQIKTKINFKIKKACLIDF